MLMSPSAPHPLRSIFVSLVVLLLGMGANNVFSAQSAPVRDKHVEARLLTDVTAIQPGVPFTLGLRFDIDPTWHTYWINPGEAGLIPSLVLDLPKGFTNGPLLFPPPIRFVIDYGFGVTEAGFGYEKKVIHSMTITPPADLKPGQKVTISGESKWLMCDPSSCVPGKVPLQIELDVVSAEDSVAPSPEAAELKAAKASLPQAVAEPITIAVEGEKVVVTAKMPAQVSPEGATLAFYPLVNHVFDPFDVPTVNLAGDTATISGKKFKSLDALPNEFSGVIAVTAGDRILSYEVSTSGVTGDAGSAADGRKDKANAPAAATDSAATSSPDELPFGGGLLGMILAAFLGGMILNIMPCVFPVISLKVMSFVGQAGESRRKVLFHALAFALGILVFFWILAAILVVLRHLGGADVGWGVQFRQPGFVILLIFVMIAVAMSLFGAIEIGASIAGFGGDLAYKTGYAGSFWSGALAVLLATPCTAPLMAPAIGFALSQTAPILFLIFTTLGLGLAAPYFAFAAFPKLLDVLPKPGPWMESFKQFMGFPMLAVAVWLIGVLSKQLDVSGLQWALGGALLLAMAIWIAGRFAAPHRSRAARTRAWVLAGLVALASVYTAWSASTMRAPASSIRISDVIAQHRAEGKHVFVDFTADWCITCKVNERVAIHTDTVQQAFRDNNIEFVIADWTNEDEDIAAILEEHGRAGVPLYLLYPADTSRPAIQIKDGLIFPSDVLEAIKQL